MIGYLKGQVIVVAKDHIIIDVNGVGYQVLVSLPYQYSISEQLELYIYHHIKEDQSNLFGFANLNLKDVFLKLISVKGVGPKTALSILASVDYMQLTKAIENNDIATLKKLPGIGLKSASQIVLDLQGKLVFEEVNINSELNDALEALLALGYKTNDIKKIEKTLASQKQSTEEYIKTGLQLLLK